MDANSEHNRAAASTRLEFATTQEFRDLYDALGTIFSMTALEERHLTAESREIPRVQGITDENHRAIIKYILADNEYLAWLGPYGAIFHRYFGEDYRTFRLLNQQLNLAMKRIYHDESPRISGAKERDAINDILCGHLERMLDRPALFGVKLGQIYKNLVKSLNSKASFTLTPRNVMAVEMSPLYSTLVHSNVQRLQQETRDNVDELVRLRAEMLAERNRVDGLMAELRAQLATRPQRTAGADTENNPQSTYSKK